jgi:iron complex outermembrane receptor protein/vitamin B12 transporter
MRPALAVPIAAASLLAQAQSAEQTAPAAPLADVVVTGSRLPITSAGLAQSVTVLDRRQIEEANPARIEDVLSRVPGIYVDQVGSTGGFTSVYMRGAEQSHLLIMLDGVKLNDPTTTRGSAFDLSSIDITQVERIEVLRGPASAVHGADALAGVLNIITRRAVQPGAAGSAYVAAGQRGYGRYGGSAAFGTDTVRGQVSAGRVVDGGDSYNASQSVNTYSGSLRFVPSALFLGEVFAYRGDRESAAFPDDSGGPRLAVNRMKTTRESIDTVYGARIAAGDSRQVLLNAGVSSFDRSEKSNNPFVAPGVRFPVPAYLNQTDFRRTTYSASLTRDWGPGTSLVVGAEHQTEKGSSLSLGDFDFDGVPDTPGFDLERTTRSYFAEARVQVARPVSLQLGVRYDDISAIGSQTTPHVGAVWSLPDGVTKLKANYSEGFKPPSFFALGFPIGGNPALRPERSRNTELTWARSLGAAGSTQVSAFYIDYTDLVDFDPTTFTNVNRGKVTVKGIEPSVRYRFPFRLRTDLSVTLLDIDEKDGLPPLRNRPTRLLNGTAVYDIDSRSAVFAIMNAGGRFIDRSNPTGDINMGGAGTVSVGYSIRLWKVLTRLTVDNLFNKQYEQFVGFPAQGRRVRGELRIDL